MNRDFRDLRGKFDGDDPFMTGGHQTLNTAGASKHADRMANVPVWALDDQEVQKLLLRSFPKLQTDKKQREGAARWMRIIHLYYRVGMTQNAMAEEMNISVNTLKRLIVSIRRASNGEKANGIGIRSMRPPGRPRKPVYPENRCTL